MAARSPKGVFEDSFQRIKQLMREINHSRLYDDKGRNGIFSSGYFPGV
jgi:hypothetical protein